jgi:hypothetical protein
MTTILEAALNRTVKGAAYTYVEAGCSIIPVKGKKPCIRKWEDFKESPTRVGHVVSWERGRVLYGVGIICGAVSGNLVVLDLDSMEACAEFESAFPYISDTMTIRSGSGRGRHYYFYADSLPLNTWLYGAELRSDGAYVVAPPTVHPSGRPYTVENPVNVRRVSDLAEVRDWIIQRAERFKPPTPPRPKASYPVVKDGSRYGRAALQSECLSVSHAPEGTRNRTLYRAALKMGSLIASGQLAKHEVETALEVAAFALSQSDGVEATRRTIASGLNIGLQNPRQVS